MKGSNPIRFRQTPMWAMVLMAVLALATAAAAANLEDGNYTLTVPGAGTFEFTIDSDSATETVIAVAAPAGYELDDDDPDKAAWKEAAGLEVEVKIDKVEADVVWDGGQVTLALPGGGSITITQPDADGSFTVTASSGWSAFGEGKDWYVANNSDIEVATAFFKVEADTDGAEIKAVDEVDDGFLNDLEEEEVEVEEEEVEVEEEEVEVEDDDDRGRDG